MRAGKTVVAAIGISFATMAGAHAQVSAPAAAGTSSSVGGGAYPKTGQDKGTGAANIERLGPTMSGKPGGLGTSGMAGGTTTTPKVSTPTVPGNQPR